MLAPKPSPSETSARILHRSRTDVHRAARLWRRTETGQVLFEEGDIFYGFFFVLGGEVA